MNMPNGPHCICPDHFTGKHCQKGKEMLKLGALGSRGGHGPTEEAQWIPRGLAWSKTLLRLTHCFVTREVLRAPVPPVLSRE